MPSSTIGVCLVHRLQLTVLKLGTPISEFQSSCHCVIWSLKSPILYFSICFSSCALFLSSNTDIASSHQTHETGGSYWAWFERRKLDYIMFFSVLINNSRHGKVLIARLFELCQLNSSKSLVNRRAIFTVSRVITSGNWEPHRWHSIAHAWISPR